MVTADDVRDAMTRIAPYVHRTPVLTSRSLNERAGADLFFKCENLQRVGAFKARGAFNALLCLDPDHRARGVVTHSSGNHGAALALAARSIGIPAWVVVPNNAPNVKRAAIARLGAEIVDSGPTLADRETMLEDVRSRTGAHFVPPYNDETVIAGQGTAALELLEEHPDLDEIWVPIGGGGLAGGSALVAAEQGVQLVGAQPALADDALASLLSGELQGARPPRTIADGLRTSLGTITFAILRNCGVPVFLASEAQIEAAMKLLMQRLKVVVEPSAAVPLAALLARGATERTRSDRPTRIGIILTGGNIDLDDRLKPYGVDDE